MTDDVKEDDIPQTTKVFDVPQLVVDQHEWRQEGYYIMDACSPGRPDCHNVGIPIPSGNTLIKKEGRYDLIPEGN